MSKRSKLTLPRYINLTLNFKTGLYESIENGVTYQLTFSQMNDLKIYCRVSHGSMIPTIETWYNDLTSYSRKAVKFIKPEIEGTQFYPYE
jgi:hypothetical protein